MTKSSLTLAAALEKKRRLQARKSLIAFTEYTYRGYSAAAHHRLIASKLEAVAERRITRLIIEMPPRHGKSELASKRFPAWYLGRFPDHQIIAASYGSDLARDFGREVRNIVATAEYARLFDTELRHDSKAADRWHTNKGGVYVASGVDTATTGRGANLLLIDDPVKDRKSADSETTRRHTRDWYTSVAYTRLMPDAVIVVIQTRWNDDDLAGWLQAEMAKGGDQWDVLSLPAINAEGQALWPEWYPIERLKQIRTVLPTRDWSALYQQKPQADEGNYFKRAWVRKYTQADIEDDYGKFPLRVVGASDYAVTEDDGDYTVHIVVGVDPNDRMFVLDLWRAQTDSKDWVEAFCDLVLKWKPLFWAEESGQILASVGPYLASRQRARKAYVARERFPSRHEKAVRARSIQGRISLNGLYVPHRQTFTLKATNDDGSATEREVEWVADFENELFAFPASKNDDQADALGLIGQLLDRVTLPEWPKDETEVKTGARNIAIPSKPSGVTFNDLLQSNKARLTK